MADDADDGGGQGQPDGALDERVGKLEAGQESIAGKVDKILGMLGGGGGDEGHEPEGNGGNVGLEIRRQLDERDARRRDEDARRGVSDRVGALETQVSEMRETKPGPLPKRVHKIMGWAE